jgi:hypothetical protein
MLLVHLCHCIETCPFLHHQWTFFRYKNGAHRGLSCGSREWKHSEVAIICVAFLPGLSDACGNELLPTEVSIIFVIGLFTSLINKY